MVANPSNSPDYIDGRIHSQRADGIGLGLAYTFDPAPTGGEAADPAAKAKSWPLQKDTAAGPVTGS